MWHWIRLLTQINRTLWYVTVAMQASTILVKEFNRYQGRRREDQFRASHRRTEESR